MNALPTDRRFLSSLVALTAVLLLVTLFPGKLDAQRSLEIQDFSATIATALGLPLEKRIFAPNGRPFFVANGGTPIMPFFS